MSASSFRDDFFDLKDLENQNRLLEDKSKLVEMLRLQLSEFEMLQSMFSNQGELCIDDPSVLADINEYVEGKCPDIPRYLDYTINLDIDKVKLKVHITLPSEYPENEPDIFVRSDKLNRDQQHSLNKDLSDFVATLDRGDICVLQAIPWLQENALQYVTAEEEKKLTTCSNEIDVNFARLWIYSHHIFSKIKRREILDLSRDLNITGFCLPGRPGIICIEGMSRNCEDWWYRIRHLNWKKINCIKRELEPIDNESNCNSLRKFSNFEELSFMGEKNGSKGRNGHMDMGALLRYLDNHNCAHAFHDYFGIDGKIPEG